MSDQQGRIDAVVGGPVDGAIETAAAHAVLDADGTKHKTAVWLVLACGRLHLIAPHPSAAFHVSTGDKSEAAIEGRLTRDVVRVGPYTAALQRRSRRDAEALVEKFAGTATGSPFERPGLPAAGSILPAAMDVPDWWASVVGGDAVDPWLIGVKTSSSFPIFDFEGNVRDSPIWISVSEKRVVAAAYHAEHLFQTRELTGGFDHIEKLGRDEVRTDELRVSLGGRAAALIVELAPLGAADRIARLVRHALSKGDYLAAASYVRRTAQEHDGSNSMAWRTVASRLAIAAWVLDQPDLALALVTPATKMMRLDDAIVFERRARSRLDKADQATRANLVEAIQTLEPTPAAPPRDFPWPPARLDELWAAAAANRGNREVAQTMLVALDEPRRRHAKLTFTDPEADDWREVAQAYADLGDFVWARRLLHRAIATDGNARDHLRDAAWAWRAGRPEESGAAFERALVIGVETADLEQLAGLLPVPDAGGDAFQRLADAAATRKDTTIAARLFVEREHKAPSAADEVEAVAHRCANELASPREGALLLETLARRMDASTEDDDAGHGETARLWLDAAALRGRAGEGSIAAHDLSSALAAEFLRPENYRRALDTPGADLSDEARAWWSHLHAVLAGEPVTRRPVPPVTSLDAAALDNLHPGGGGWLDGLRHAIQEPEPPDRATLTRGLARLTAEAYPAAGSAIDDLTLALDIGHPECFVYRGDDAYGVCVWPIASPILLIGYQHLDPDHPRHLAPGALRFALAVELTHLACRHPILSFESNFLGTSHSAYQTFGKYAGTAETLVDVVTMLPGVDQVAKLQRVVRITRRVFSTKSAVEKVAGLAAGPLARFLPKDERVKGIGREKLEGAALQFRVQADRTALLLTGDFLAAVEAILTTSAAFEALERIRSEGLARVLADQGALPPRDALRLSALAAFASQEMPRPA